MFMRARTITGVRRLVTREQGKHAPRISRLTSEDASTEGILFGGPPDLAGSPVQRIIAYRLELLRSPRRANVST